MCHSSQTLWFIHLRAQGLREGEEHPALAHHRAGPAFTFYTERQSQRYRRITKRKEHVNEIQIRSKSLTFTTLQLQQQTQVKVY